jgi:hypothetical protein
MAGQTIEQCPDPISNLEPWQIAELHQIDAHRLITGPEDAAGRLFLSLAVAFNDLKGLVMFGQYLARYPRRPSDEISAYAGQWRGINLQIVRWIAGVLEETMKVIRMEGVGVIDTDAFRALLGGIHEQHREAWETLVEVATAEREREVAGGAKKPRSGSLARVLYDVRNTAAFHYFGSEIGPAYDAVFDPARRIRCSIHGEMPAYYSPGRSMETTRFYFGDAAVQQKLLAAGGESDKPADDVIVEHAVAMNHALGVLISEFIKSRGGGPSKR